MNICGHDTRSGAAIGAAVARLGVSLLVASAIGAGSASAVAQAGHLALADVRAYPATSRALKLDIRTVVAGHWTPEHGPELIDHYLGLLARAGSGASR